jgi:hypothetical protein
MPHVPSAKQASSHPSRSEGGGKSAGFQPGEPGTPKPGGFSPGALFAPENESKESATHPLLYQGTASAACPEQALSEARSASNGCRKRVAPKALPCCRRPSAEARSAWSRLALLSYFRSASSQGRFWHRPKAPRRVSRRRTRRVLTRGTPATKTRGFSPGRFAGIYQTMAQVSGQRSERRQRLVFGFANRRIDGWSSLLRPVKGGP